jgi:proline iminopeptidase
MGCHDIPYAREGYLATQWGRIWYGVAGAGPQPPVLTLHGGPGVPHYYFMHAMGELGDERPVVFYHQLGCGRSERPGAPALWTAERFADELVAVVQGLRDARALDSRRFHLWGHSWGTALAVLYALTQPPGLLSLTLASPILDISAYRQDLERLLARQPSRVQDAIRTHAPGTPEYTAAVDAFYRAHLYRTDPWDACALKAFSASEFGADSYMATVGPSELNYTGNFRDRDDSARLGEVGVPTLLLVGRHDLATPETAAAYQRTLPRGTLVVLENSSHWYFEEERAAYLTTLRQFLREHDGPAAAR